LEELTASCVKSFVKKAERAGFDHDDALAALRAHAAA